MQAATIDRISTRVNVALVANGGTHCYLHHYPCSTPAALLENFPEKGFGEIFYNKTVLRTVLDLLGRLKDPRLHGDLI